MLQQRVITQNHRLSSLPPAAFARHLLPPTHLRPALLSAVVPSMRVRKNSNGADPEAPFFLSTKASGPTGSVSQSSDEPQLKRVLLAVAVAVCGAFAFGALLLRTIWHLQYLFLLFLSLLTVFICSDSHRLPLGSGEFQRSKFRCLQRI